MPTARKLAALALISLAVLISGCGLIPAAESWNFLVYLDGDNNLEPFAIDDFNEMERVGSSANLRILVLFDRSLYYDQSNGNWTGTRLYLVNRDKDLDKIHSTLLADYGELDMSNPATLGDFLVYCQTNYPADHTALTLWNHGSGVWPRAVQPGGVSPPPSAGPFKGIAWDDTTGTGDWDCLTTDEVAQALYAARQATATGRKIDVINMDACLMQMLEVAYEWKDEADYLVGSEENVPGPGNDYARSLAGLARFSRLSAERFSFGLVESYHATYDGGYNDTTYSALRLGLDFTDLAAAFAGFATALKNTADLPGVYAAWQDTTSFSAFGSECDDLYSLAGEAGAHVADPLVASAAAGLQQALTKAIVKHAETGWYVGKAFGLSVLLPSALEWPNYSGTDQYVTLKLSQDTDWDEFVARFAAYTAGL